MDDLHISLYRGSSGETVTLESYLAMDSAERAEVAADLEQVTISLVVGGQERLAHRLSLGPLRRLVPQFDPARQRLMAQEQALIRSGVLDIPEGIYLLFEPNRGSERVLVSVITIEELPMSGWFPDERWVKELYQYVGEQRDQLLTSARQQPSHLIELDVGCAVLEAALAREAEAGRTLLSELGEL